jgi:hypothetical protein
MQVLNVNPTAVNRPSPNGDGVISDAMVCLVYAWLAATPADREAAIRALGCDHVGDTLFAALG